MTAERKSSAGRKPYKDKKALKRQVYIYVEQAIIDELGGMDGMRDYLLRCVDQNKRIRILEFGL